MTASPFPWVLLVLAPALLAAACEKRPSPGPVSVILPPAPPPEPPAPTPLPLPASAESTPIEPAAPRPFDVQAWLAGHRVTAPDFGYSDCRATQLGRPPLDGLVCTGGPPMLEASLRSGHSVFPMVALVADAGKLRIAMRTAVMAGPLDPEGDGDPAYVRLTVDVSRDGMRVELRDSPPRTCADALTWAAKLGDPPTARMVRLACASRGVYVWSRGRFERTSR